MVLHSLGYLFEGRYDINKNFGLCEEFSALTNKGIMTAKFVTAADSQLNILIPARMDVVDGFQPLQYTTDEDLNQFIKSNKPVFCPSGSFVYIINGAVGFDVETHEMVKLDVDAYIMKGVSDKFAEIYNHRGDQEPAAICDKAIPVNEKELVGTRGVYNTINFSNIVLEGLKLSMKKWMTFESCSNRGQFLKARMLMER